MQVAAIGSSSYSPRVSSLTRTNNAPDVKSILNVSEARFKTKSSQELTGQTHKLLSFETIQTVEQFTSISFSFDQTLSLQGDLFDDLFSFSENEKDVISKYLEAEELFNNNTVLTEDQLDLIDFAESASINYQQNKNLSPDQVNFLNEFYALEEEYFNSLNFSQDEIDVIDEFEELNDNIFEALEDNIRQTLEASLDAININTPEIEEFEQLAFDFIDDISDHLVDHFLSATHNGNSESKTLSISGDISYSKYSLSTSKSTHNILV